MFKKILIVIIFTILILTLTGCTINKQEAIGLNRFRLISDEGSFKLYYDKETRVVYAVSDGYYNLGAVTLLVDKDGKPLTYDKY